MPLPELDRYGDLPVGVHQASLDEVIARFGHGTPQRRLVAMRLLRIMTSLAALANSNASLSLAVMSPLSPTQMTLTSSS